MATQMRNGLWLEDGCLCAGTGCGGHLVLNPAFATMAGHLGTVQHTYSTACDGLHAPGPCPPSRQQPVRLNFGG